ncbi:MAG: glycosyltransferase family 39 protein [Candidatus Levybacteria bacterium]|nr:glycosyltransferase family 39 protein [Candidatus Levybacteria bacterium]
MINILNKKLTTYIILILIILIGIFLRFYQLGSNPPSLTWDEVSLGYNAYSILKTGSDEYGNRFPLSIRSFDDHKPPLYAYLAVPSIAIFGLNEFSVRLPSAIIGVLSVVAIYFLVKEFLQRWDKKHQELIALASALFLAISPWHLQFSRGAFEGNIGLFFLLVGILFFLKGLNRSNLFLLSSFSFVLSIYSYHSFRLLVPLILLFFGIIFWKKILKGKLYFIISILLLGLLVLPVYFSFIKTQDSSSRLSMVTIFSDPTVINSSIERLSLDKNNNDYIGSLIHNRRIVYSLAMAKNYFDHFNPDFLFFHGDGGLQHHAVEMGMLYLWDLPFIVIGLYFLFRKFDRYILTLVILFLIAPLPASITTGTPHPIRAITLLAPFHIFSAIGFVFLTSKILGMRKIIYKVIFLPAIILSLLLNFIYYMHQYYVHTPIEYGYFWQYGYKDALVYARENEAEFDKIVMTYEYDQPYIYYLFYNKIDPLWYQKNWDNNKNGLVDRFERSIGKYTFKNINYSKDIDIPNTLLIGTPKEIPDNAKVIKTIKFPDGRVAFEIVKT